MYCFQIYKNPGILAGSSGTKRNNGNPPLEGLRTSFKGELRLGHKEITLTYMRLSMP